MKTKVGIWIDHRKAVVMIITNDAHEIKVIPSDMEKHIRFSGGAVKESEENQRDRRFKNHLNQYYDKVISLVADAEAIFIIGPGEAKVEFKKRLEINANIGMIIGIDTVDKMSVRQFEAKIKKYFMS